MRGVPALGAGGRTFESCHPEFKNLIISSIMGFSVRTSPDFPHFYDLLVPSGNSAYESNGFRVYCECICVNAYKIFCLYIIKLVS